MQSCQTTFSDLAHAYTHFGVGVYCTTDFYSRTFSTVNTFLLHYKRACGQNRFLNNSPVLGRLKTVPYVASNLQSAINLEVKLLINLTVVDELKRVVILHA